MRPDPVDRFASGLRAPRKSKPVQTVRVANLDTAVMTRRELAQLMVEDCLERRTSDLPPRLVFSSNGQGISLAGLDASFARVMGEADIVHADGMSAVFASRLLCATPLPERVATTDFFHDAAKAACAAGLRFFFLGASEAQNAAAVAAIARLYPDLAIAGRYHGYFGDEEDEALCARIRASGADVLWVAMGKPRQENWAVQNRDRLRGVGWIKTCGGLYSFLAGDARRAPAWMQKAGFEWLHRFAQEPGRLGPRYVLTNAHALWRLARHTGAAKRDAAAV
jgi:N-acetylglucosaminyldiphosphoundecaprenol N-acetyl-beta-D-mannosaminyltransferase